MSIGEIKKILIWWDKRNNISNDYLIKKVMDLGTWEMVKFVENKFGQSKFKECLKKLNNGELSRKSFNYWKIKLGLNYLKYPKGRNF